MASDIVERLRSLTADTGRDYRSGEEFIMQRSQRVVDAVREAADTIANLRRELDEANADCKRANEMINAAVSDYNEAVAEIKARADAYEQACRERDEARANALEEAATEARGFWKGSLASSYQRGWDGCCTAISPPRGTTCRRYP